jgi:hypothetical protein
MAGAAPAPRTRDVDKLAVLDQVERQLATIQTVDEAKSIRDRAEAIRLYAKSARKGLKLQNRAAWIKISAEQRGGSLLKQIPRGSAGRPQPGKRIMARLAAILQASEIAPRTGRMWQVMAAIPPAEVKRLEAELTENRKELTSALIYETASRAAHETKRKAKATAAEAAIEQGVEDFTQQFKLQRFDVWTFAGLDPGYGKPWPGNLPASLVANVLYYFTDPGALVVDPMAGGGVTGDVCRALGRRCVMSDAKPCPERADIRTHLIENGPLPGTAKTADLVFLDPPYWTLKDKEYGNVAGQWRHWLEWLQHLATMAADTVRPGGYVALLMQDNLTKNVQAGDWSRQSTAEAYAALTRAGLVPQIQIAVPLSTQQVNARDMEWAKLHRRVLGILRMLLVFRKPT